MRMLAAFLAGLLLLAMPAFADMFPDASNAKRPEANRNLGNAYTVKPGESIQAALTAAATNAGGTVYVQKGTYTVSGSSLLMSSNTALMCEQGATIAVASAGWTGAKAGLQNTNFASAALLDHDIRIDGCNWTVDVPLAADAGYHAIQLTSVRRARITNNNFSSGGNGTAIIHGDDVVTAHNSMGMRTTGTTHGNTMLDGLASTAGVYVGSVVQGPNIPYPTTVTAINSATSVTLSQAATGSLPGQAIVFNAALNACYDHWQASQHIMVTDNYCATAVYGVLLTGTNSAGVSGDHSHSGTIKGNLIDLAGTQIQAAVWLNGIGAVGSGASEVIVSGNMALVDGVSNLTCYKISGDSRNNILIGNTCRNSGPSSRFITIADDSGGSASNTLVIGNIADNISTVIGNTAIIAIAGSNNAAFGNKVIGGSYPFAFYLAGTDNAIAGNFFPTGTSGRINTAGAVRPSIGTPEPPEIYAATPGDPTPTNSEGFVMAGLNNGISAITPKTTGTVALNISGVGQSAAPGAGFVLHAAYGTGTGPANGVALPAGGVQCGNQPSYLSGTTPVGWYLTCTLSGLTLGQPYWIDVQQAAYGGAVVLSLKAITMSAYELH